MIRDIGIELPHMQAVRDEVRDRAFRMLHDGYRNGEDRRAWVMTVKDEAGATVLSVTLGEAISPELMRSAGLRAG